MQLTTKTIEQRIRDGLFANHKAGDQSDDFVKAIYELFSKFAARYTQQDRHRYPHPEDGVHLGLDFFWRLQG